MRIRTGSLAILFTLALALGIGIARGVGSLALGAGEVLMNESHAARERQEAQRPPERLPIRPGDYRSFPRREFGFRWSDEDGNVVDTFRGVVTKDLISHPDTTVRLVLTSAELDSIYEAVIRMRVLDPATPFKPDPLPCSSGSRSQCMILLAGAFARELNWESGCTRYGPRTDDGKLIWELVMLIRRQVERHEEFRSLPSPSGSCID